MKQRNWAELLAGAVVLLVAVVFLAYGISNSGRHHITGVRFYAEFDNVGTLSDGADVRIAGVKVGTVDSMAFDPKTYRAKVNFSVAKDVQLPQDSSAQIASAGLLGAPTLALVPGGSDTMLKDGQQVQITQSAADLESLLGKFIFNVGSLADASQKQLQREQQGAEPARKGDTLK